MGRGSEQQEETTSLWRVVAALLVAQVIAGSHDVVTNIHPVYGTKHLVRSFYGDVVALLVLFPAALIFERRNSLKLSRRVVVQLFLLGLIGVAGTQLLLFAAMMRTSGNFLSAMLQPSVPLFTAVMAIAFGVEKLNLRRRDSRAKLAGATLCCAGAVLMTLYRGPPVVGWFNVNAVEPHASRFPVFGIDDENVGAFCLLGSCLCMASFINLQALLLKHYPAPVSVVAYSYLFGAIVMGAASYFLVHDPSEAWVVGWNFELVVVVVYDGIIFSAVNFGLVSFALSKVGPLFVASSIPVQAISSTLLGLIFLKSVVYLGSVLGAGLVILGLLLVAWARQESMRLRTLARIVERSGRFRVGTAEAHAPELRAPLLQV